ncbi:Lysophospholipase L1 [Sphingomonas guangdongensis]|uniref:Chitooligosaccharide deacetylase n=1 Tax=Sphingomonas guangdongensis TaxID=1141890 RepID=A0A285R0T1_9SPHN|nr:GDSL-type esterase/lipase family protein [Sphingomonas guangdongensis]SOB87398.1 Lysophospholipase L1 [Sphingomonas guangdongensis]
MGRLARASALIAAMLLACPSSATTPTRSRWIASWGTAQMVPTPENALPANRTRDVTIRQKVRLSAGGTRVRVRFSNVFGTEPLVIGAAHLARPAAGASLRPDSGQPLRFAGEAGVTIAAGAEAYADPVAMAVEPGADLSISLYVAGATAGQTGHQGARATSYLAAGNHVADATLIGAEPTTRWYHIADVEVEGTQGTATIVAIGDSITDGYGVQPDTHQRWTDRFAERLRADPATRAIGLVNAGIGGNRVLLDGLGPNLQARFDRDVIARSGIRWAILLEGINDLGVLTKDRPASAAEHAAIVRRITQGYAQVVARAHAHGIQVIAGTIMPFVANEYYHPGAATEADRQAVNSFIRTSGLFDAVIDFDQLLRDPARPDRLAAAFDSGDGLHPSMAGYKAMGDAIPLALFADAAEAPATKLSLTFDDVPDHGPLPAGVTMSDTVGSIAASLKAAGVPEAYGFLNAGRGVGADGARAARLWRQAGYPLANHGFRHRDLAEMDAATFEQELLANEPALKASGTRDWRWFRYPFLSEGRSPAALDAARAVLRRHGYRIAAVTMDFGDYGWNGAYARCLALGDAAAITALEDSYLAAAHIAAIRARASSAPAQPLVLLMHVGAFDARMLPRLLALYRQLNFTIVPLAEAQAHPAYAASNDLSLPGPSTSRDEPASLALLRAPLPDAVCA